LGIARAYFVEFNGKISWHQRRTAIAVSSVPLSETHMGPDGCAGRRSPRARARHASRARNIRGYADGVTLDFSRPGKPTDNAFIEAFNGRFRAECLNAHWFMTLDDVRSKLEDWRKYHNEERPHGAIRQRPPILLHNYDGAHNRSLAVKRQLPAVQRMVSGHTFGFILTCEVRNCTMKLHFYGTPRFATETHPKDSLQRMSNLRAGD
jgi:hypothetical protein